MPLTSDQIEAAARALAIFDGKDPSASTARDPNAIAPKVWETYVREVKRFETLLAGVASAPSPPTPPQDAPPPRKVPRGT